MLFQLRNWMSLLPLEKQLRVKIIKSIFFYLSVLHKMNKIQTFLHTLTKSLHQKRSVSFINFDKE